MLLYMLHTIIQTKRPEWAASQVLQDHMAVVCGGVWAVVSVSVPLFGVKGLGEGGKGDYIYTRTHSRFQNTLKHTPPSTIAHHQCHHSSIHDPDIFNQLYAGAIPDI